ncbi:MAG: 50S ribosomal protein L22 [Ignavibacteriaceae bacterium]|nr:50S ribosomal protein L22 [Ignavibacteriaceae bacterium]NUM69813.1 50S ribosomal protein L22 [Ignavibacteriaceae bacterium]
MGLESRAVYRYIPSSPRKMRLLADLVRGLPVLRAMEILKFHKKHASNDMYKVVKSAVSNLVNNNDDQKISPENVFISRIYVDQGPTAKRIMPAPMGRAYRIRKRSCHLTVIVETKN